MRLPLVRRSAFATALARLTAVKEEAARMRAERDEALAERDEGRRALESTGLQLADAEAGLASLRATPDPMEGLTAEDVRDLLERFRNGNSCPTCNGIHVRSCPRVKSIRYGRQGDSVYTEEVRYWPDWDDTGVIFSDMLPDPDEMPEPDDGTG